MPVAVVVALGLLGGSLPSPPLQGGLAGHWLRVLRVKSIEAARDGELSISLVSCLRGCNWHEFLFACKTCGFHGVALKLDGLRHEPLVLGVARDSGDIPGAWRALDADLTGCLNLTLPWCIVQNFSAGLGAGTLP